MEHFIKNYFDDDTKRESLNSLTREIFGFDFTDWYGDGYYTGEYIPYSFEINGKIVSNASANIMNFTMINMDGELTERTYIQIGTVMTAPNYRRMGFAGKLIREIIKDYGSTCDGIYLFGNLSALEFYSGLGFWKSMQYRVLVKNNIAAGNNADFICIEKVRDKRTEYVAMVRNAVYNSSFEQTNKFGLQMFYTGGFQNVYYSESLNCFASYDCDGKTLYLNSIIADRNISVTDILVQIPNIYERVIVGFTPREKDLELFDFEEFDGSADEYRLFCIGNTLKEIEENKLYFPHYSHA